MPGVTTLTVSRAEDGQKLLQYLERRLRGAVPRSAIQKWIRTGQVRVDGGRKKPFDRIAEGQLVRIPPYDAPAPEGQERGKDRKPDALDAGSRTGSRKPAPGLRVVHEDDDLVVLAKPAGLPAHGGTGHDDSVAARLAARHAGSDFAPTLAHRLDRDTSGLLLAAKTYNKLRELNDLIASGGLRKTYLAWVRGRWPHAGEITLEDRLEKSGAPGEERVTAGSGKVALARVRPLLLPDADCGEKGVSLLAVTLLTGRTHQIRVQLAERGHPIVGDRKYGLQDGRNAKKNISNSAMYLHAFQLVLPGLELRLPPPWQGRYAVPEHILHTFPADRQPDPSAAR
ncbi:RluA family pseudouridine synthase [Paucidesulfovibrio longus]|uniref:RluA family pseudouridine synthase n=1 Tax=Paucidesulfovibrio longus TaxID=889 RepID=UPI0003B51BE2|nr:RluA family pseudouridine synthase [Paucidesulfovibrio longus]